jgi:ankyrin repeat protein
MATVRVTCRFSVAKKKTNLSMGVVVVVMIITFAAVASVPNAATLGQTPNAVAICVSRTNSALNASELAAMRHFLQFNTSLPLTNHSFSYLVDGESKTTPRNLECGAFGPLTVQEAHRVSIAASSISIPATSYFNSPATTFAFYVNASSDAEFASLVDAAVSTRLASQSPSFSAKRHHRKTQLGNSGIVALCFGFALTVVFSMLAFAKFQRDSFHRALSLAFFAASAVIMLVGLVIVSVEFGRTHEPSVVIREFRSDLCGASPLASASIRITVVATRRSGERCMMATRGLDLNPLWVRATCNHDSTVALAASHSKEACESSQAHVTLQAQQCSPRSSTDLPWLHEETQAFTVSCYDVPDATIEFPVEFVTPRSDTSVPVQITASDAHNGTINVIAVAAPESLACSSSPSNTLGVPVDTYEVNKGTSASVDIAHFATLAASATKRHLPLGSPADIGYYKAFTVSMWLQLNRSSTGLVFSTADDVYSASPAPSRFPLQERLRMSLSGAGWIDAAHVYASVIVDGSSGTLWFVKSAADGTKVESVNWQPRRLPNVVSDVFDGGLHHIAFRSAKGHESSRVTITVDGVRSDRPGYQQCFSEKMMRFRTLPSPTGIALDASAGGAAANRLPALLVGYGEALGIGNITFHSRRLDDRDVLVSAGYAAQARTNVAGSIVVGVLMLAGAAVGISVACYAHLTADEKNGAPDLPPPAANTAAQAATGDKDDTTETHAQNPKRQSNLTVTLTRSSKAVAAGATGVGVTRSLVSSNGSQSVDAASKASAALLDFVNRAQALALYITGWSWPFQYTLPVLPVIYLPSLDIRFDEWFGIDPLFVPLIQLLVAVAALAVGIQVFARDTNRFLDTEIKVIRAKLLIGVATDEATNDRVVNDPDQELDVENEPTTICRFNELYELHIGDEHIVDVPDALWADLAVAVPLLCRQRQDTQLLQEYAKAYPHRVARLPRKEDDSSAFAVNLFWSGLGSVTVDFGFAAGPPKITFHPKNGDVAEFSSEGQLDIRYKQLTLCPVHGERLINALDSVQHMKRSTALAMGQESPYACIHDHSKFHLLRKNMCDLGGGFSCCSHPLCTYAVCSACHDLAPANKLLRVYYTKRAEWGDPSHVIGLVAVVVIESILVPAIKNCMMILTCHPEYQCTFGIDECYSASSMKFILAACLALALAIGLGVVLPMWIFALLLRRKHAVLRDLFLVPEAELTWWRVCTMQSSDADWLQVVRCDTSIMKSIYGALELRYMWLWPAVMIIKVASVVVVVVTESESLTQLTLACAVEALQLSILVVARPYADSWADVLTTGGSVHQVLVLALFAFYRINRNESLAWLLLTVSTLYIIFLFGCVGKLIKELRDKKIWDRAALGLHHAARVHDLEVVDMVLDSAPLAVFEIDTYGDSLLHVLARMSTASYRWTPHYESQETILRDVIHAARSADSDGQKLEQLVRLKNRDGLTCLQLAVMTGRDLIPMLTGDQFLEAAIFRDRLLHYCSTTDSVYAVLKIVKDNFGRASSDDLLETTDYRNDTPLMAAIRAGRPDVATFIIDHFAEQGNSNTPMPLDIAVESGNPDCVRACVRKRPAEDTTILDPQFYFITTDPSRNFFETAISQGAGMLRALIHVKDEVPGLPGLANGSHLMNDAKNAEEYHYAARLSHVDSLGAHRELGMTYPGQPSVYLAWTDALPLVMEFDLSFSNIQNDDHICPILTLELPVRMFDELHSLQCNGSWVDQGFGNQKGQLGCAYIHHASNLFEKRAPHTPEEVNTFVRFPENFSERVESIADGIANGTLSETNTVFEHLHQPSYKPRERNGVMCLPLVIYGVVGSGGAHELHCMNMHIRLYTKRFVEKLPDVLPATEPGSFHTAFSPPTFEDLLIQLPGCHFSTVVDKCKYLQEDAVLDGGFMQAEANDFPSASDWHKLFSEADVASFSFGTISPTEIVSSASCEISTSAQVLLPGFVDDDLAIDVQLAKPSLAVDVPPPLTIRTRDVKLDQATQIVLKTFNTFTGQSHDPSMALVNMIAREMSVALLYDYMCTLETHHETSSDFLVTEMAKIGWIKGLRIVSEVLHRLSGNINDKLRPAWLAAAGEGRLQVLDALIDACVEPPPFGDLVAALGSARVYHHLVHRSAVNPEMFTALLRGEMDAPEHSFLGDLLKSYMEGARLDLLQNMHELEPTCLHIAAPGSGLGAIEYAIDAGNARLVSWLISECGVDVNATVNGRSPLHVACELDKGDIVTTLITLGARIDAEDDNGALPLETALGRSCNRASSALLSYVPEVDVHGTSRALTPLQIATNCLNVNAVRPLLLAGADPRHHGTDSSYPCPIALAIAIGCQMDNYKAMAPMLRAIFGRLDDYSEALPPWSVFDQCGIEDDKGTEWRPIDDLIEYNMPVAWATMLELKQVDLKEFVGFALNTDLGELNPIEHCSATICDRVFAGTPGITMTHVLAAFGKKCRGTDGVIDDFRCNQAHYVSFAEDEHIMNILREFPTALHGFDWEGRTPLHYIAWRFRQAALTIVGLSGEGWSIKDHRNLTPVDYFNEEQFPTAQFWELPAAAAFLAIKRTLTTQQGFTRPGSEDLLVQAEVKVNHIGDSGIQEALDSA